MAEASNDPKNEHGGAQELPPEATQKCNLRILTFPQLTDG